MKIFNQTIDETPQEDGKGGLVPSAPIFKLLLKCMKYIGVSAEEFPEVDRELWRSFFDETRLLWKHRQSSFEMKCHINRDDDSSNVVLAGDQDAERWLRHTLLWKWYAVVLVAKSEEARHDPLLVQLYLIFSDEFIGGDTTECSSVSKLDFRELTDYLLENFPKMLQEKRRWDGWLVLFWSNWRSGGASWSKERDLPFQLRSNDAIQCAPDIFARWVARQVGVVLAQRTEELMDNAVEPDRFLLKNRHRKACVESLSVKPRVLAWDYTKNSSALAEQVQLCFPELHCANRHDGSQQGVG